MEARSFTGGVGTTSTGGVGTTSTGGVGGTSTGTGGSGGGVGATSTGGIDTTSTGGVGGTSTDTGGVGGGVGVTSTDLDVGFILTTGAPPMGTTGVSGSGAALSAWRVQYSNAFFIACGLSSGCVFRK
jgi:hypothetical protein